jgi:hypothetical protein
LTCADTGIRLPFDALHASRLETLAVDCEAGSPFSTRALAHREGREELSRRRLAACCAVLRRDSEWLKRRCGEQKPAQGAARREQLSSTLLESVALRNHGARVFARMRSIPHRKSSFYSARHSHDASSTSPVIFLLVCFLLVPARFHCPSSIAPSNGNAFITIAVDWTAVADVDGHHDTCTYTASSVRRHVLCRLRVASLHRASPTQIEPLNACSRALKSSRGSILPSSSPSCLVGPSDSVAGRPP